MLKYIIAAVLAAALITVISVRLRSRRIAEKNKMRAAAVLIREKRLDEDLKRETQDLYGRYRPVLQIRWKDVEKRNYLFDPLEPISVGRDPARNQIGIRLDSVSAEHCRLTMRKGKVVLEDLHSANGTWIRRGLKKYCVTRSVYLKNGDEIIVGDVSMRIDLFQFDTAYI